MDIGQPPHRYRWHDHWARLPDTPPSRNNGRTHALAVLPDGRVAVFAQTSPALHLFRPDGTLESAWGDRFLGAHGLSTVDRGGATHLWLVDEFSCEVCETTLDGTTVRRLAPPPDDQLLDGKYKPTWAAENPANGDVWVGDGYGSARYVYRYRPDGAYADRYDFADQLDAPLREPHGLAFSPAGELWITSRARHQIVVCDGDGKVLRYARHAAHSPTSFAFHDNLTYVAELFGSVSVLTPDLQRVARLGEGRVLPHADPDEWWPPQAPEGWPNLADTEYIHPGTFNSPHGIAAAPDGDLYVGEWIVGGRVTRLERL